VIVTRIAYVVVLAFGWRRALIAFLAGVASALALAPINAWPILFLTFPVLVWLVDGSAAGRFSGAWRAFGAGWCFGFGYFLAGLYWIGYAFLVDAKTFGWLLPFAVAGLPAYLAFYTALGLGAARLIWVRGPMRILALAAMLTGAEWLRGHWLSGFPWNTFGYALTEPLALAQSVSLTGVWGLTFLCIAICGSPAVLADDLRPLFTGIDRADSIAFDPHKWLYTPLPGGCVLVRDMDEMRRSFDPEYVSYIIKDEEHTDWGIDLGRHSPNFSRGFWALRIWVSLLAHGRDAYARRISHDAALARYLGELVDERDDFELMTPVGLSITCFRYVPEGLSGGRGREEYLDELNQRIMTEIQLGGRAFCSNAVLEGRFCLRSCIVNYRTEAGDVEALLQIAAETGRMLDGELRPGELR